MIFLTSFDREFNIRWPRGAGMRIPTLHLGGEYQAPLVGFFVEIYYNRLRLAL